MPPQPSQSDPAGPEIIVGLALVVGALVFQSRYGGGALSFYDNADNEVDLVPALAFLYWSAALAVLARGLLRAGWSRIRRTHRRHLS